YADGKYLLNPTATELETSELDLVVAGTEKAVLMVESEARLLSEETMLGAVMFGHREMQAAIKAINELAAEAGRKDFHWEAPAADDAFATAVTNAVGNRLVEVFKIKDKLERRDAKKALQAEVAESLASEIEAN